MYGYVYLTTCIPTGKKYIGMHKYSKKCIDESYFGSGILIAKAIRKYGKKSFRCEVLQFCETKDELSLCEQYYISLYNAVESDDFYNIDSGRGNSHQYLCEEEVRETLSSIQSNHRTVHTDTEQKVINLCELDAYLSAGWKLGRLPKDYSERVEKFKKTHYSDEYATKRAFWKKNISNSIKGRRWVNNGVEELQVIPEVVDELLLKGYTFGRLFARGKR